MKKLLMQTVADKASVVINGISIPNQDDGIKNIYLTDEIEKTYNRPWIDLRDTDIEVWYSDCCPEEFETFTRESLETWGVEIYSDDKNNAVYLIKFN